MALAMAPPLLSASALGAGSLQRLLGLCPRRHAGRREERFPSADIIIIIIDLSLSLSLSIYIYIYREREICGPVSLRPEGVHPTRRVRILGRSRLPWQGAGAQTVLDAAMANGGSPQPPRAPDVPQR